MVLAPHGTHALAMILTEPHCRRRHGSAPGQSPLHKGGGSCAFCLWGWTSINRIGPLGARSTMSHTLHVALFRCGGAVASPRGPWGGDPRSTPGCGAVVVDDHLTTVRRETPSQRS